MYLEHTGSVVFFWEYTYGNDSIIIPLGIKNCIGISGISAWHF